ncbi:hypothetical protein [Aeromonas hydrophila]
MTSLKSLKSEILEELMQQRRRAALSLDLTLVTELNKQINTITNHIAASKVPNKSVVTRRAKMAEKAEARRDEVIPVDQRIALTMIGMGLRSVVDRFPVPLTEAQRELFDSGWWRMGNDTLRSRFNGLSKNRQYNAIREELEEPMELIVRETKDGMIHIHFKPVAASLGNVVARVQISNANITRKALVRLAACIDVKRSNTQCSTISLPSAYKKEIVTILKADHKINLPEQSNEVLVDDDVKDIGDVKDIEDIEDIIGQTFNDGKLTVVGWDGERQGSNKLYQCRCSECAEDPELFGDAVFYSTKYNIVNVGSLPCGCSKRPHWTADQYKILLKRKANGKYTVSDVPDDAKVTTHVSCKCNVEECGHTWKPTIVGLLSGTGCPSCARRRK